MDRLWAPWRSKYVSSGVQPDGCIFCDLQGRNADSDVGILWRGEHGFIILNAFPYSNGHLMVVPYRHSAEPADLTGAEGEAIMAMATRAVGALRRAFSPHGYNIGMNLGRAAGAGVDAHLHMHVVPRWNGDTNFMGVVGETRVIPQSLADTYEVLKRCIDE